VNFEYAGMAVAYQRDALGFAWVTYGGIVTYRSMMGLRTWAAGKLREAFKGDVPRVFLADFRRCTLLIDAQEMNSAVQQTTSGKTIWPAGGLICRASERDPFLSHAHEMSRRGALRLVFIDEHRAREWAALRVAICSEPEAM
jgi:hypothetical protein